MNLDKFIIGDDKVIRFKLANDEGTAIILNELIDLKISLTINDKEVVKYSKAPEQDALPIDPVSGIDDCCEILIERNISALFQTGKMVAKASLYLDDGAFEGGRKASDVVELFHVVKPGAMTNITPSELKQFGVLVDSRSSSQPVNVNVEVYNTDVPADLLAQKSVSPEDNTIILLPVGITLKDSSAAVIFNQQFPAGIGVEIQVNDGVIKDSAGTVLKNVKAEGEAIINDSQINVNGNLLTNLKSEQALNVLVVDPANNPIGAIQAGKVVIPASSFNIGSIDRHGNVLPMIIISSSQTISWKARDYRDNFLANLTAPNSAKEITIDALCDALVAAGLMGKARLLNPFLGDNGADNALNLAYPFTGDAGTDKLTFINSPIHGSGFLQGTGTQHAFAPISSREINIQNLSFGFYSLNNAINAFPMIEMGFGGSGGNGLILSMMNSGALGGLPFLGINAYGNKMQVNPANAGGLIMGHQSDTVRKITQGTNILGTSNSIQPLTHQVAYGLGILAGGDGTAVCTRKLGAVWLGEFLSLGELADLNTIMQNLMTNKGVAIT